MSIFNSNQKIGDIVAKFPNAADIFKKYKILKHEYNSLA